jgi:hypothetical protein
MEERRRTVTFTQANLINFNTTPYYHCMARCVRLHTVILGHSAQIFTVTPAILGHSAQTFTSDRNLGGIKPADHRL